MSNLNPKPELVECKSSTAETPVIEAYPVRTAELGGGLSVQRALAAPRAPPRRPLVLSRPFRARELHDRQAHGRPTPPAHRAADRDLDHRGRGAAQGQPRQRAAHPARRAQSHDRRQRHRALGGDSTPPFGPSSWRAIMDGPARGPPQGCRGVRPLSVTACGRLRRLPRRLADGKPGGPALAGRGLFADRGGRAQRRARRQCRGAPRACFRARAPADRGECGTRGGGLGTRPALLSRRRPRSV